MNRAIGIGAVVGTLLGMTLGLLEITGAVRFENTPRGPRYDVLVLGLRVFRYPEDGEWAPFRPYAQAVAAREDLVLGSTLAGCAVGMLTGWIVGSLMRPTTGPDR